MHEDLHLLAHQLLESLANSIHDRTPESNSFCFNIAEVHIVEEWIRDIVEQLKKRPVLE